MKNTSVNAISWFEIPTTQLDKAQAFYESVLGRPMRREPMGPSEGAVFAYDPEGEGTGGPGAVARGTRHPRESVPRNPLVPDREAC